VRKIHYLLIAATAVVLVLAASFHQPTQAQLTALPVLLTNGTLPLPTGAATAANQATANTNLSSITSNTGAVSTNTGTLVTHAESTAASTSATAANTAAMLALLEDDESLIVCDRSATVVGKATTGDTQIIPASATVTDEVHICSVTVQAEGTTDWQLVQGTGSNCATNRALLPGAASWGFSTTTGLLGINRGGGLGSILHSDAGQAICVVQSDAVQTNFEVRYTYLTP
jgi:hypothetical protein